MEATHMSSEGREAGDPKTFTDYLATFVFAKSLII
jgi:hypothetical protein